MKTQVMDWPELTAKTGRAKGVPEPLGPGSCHLPVACRIRAPEPQDCYSGPGACGAQVSYSGPGALRCSLKPKFQPEQPSRGLC